MLRALAVGGHAHQPVFHDVQQADAVFAAQLVELEDDLLGAQLLAVHGHGHTPVELQFHIGGGVRRVGGRYAHLQEAGLLILRLVARVLQVETLMQSRRSALPAREASHAFACSGPAGRSPAV